MKYQDIKCAVCEKPFTDGEYVKKIKNITLPNGIKIGEEKVPVYFTMDKRQHFCCAGHSSQWHNENYYNKQGTA